MHRFARASAYLYACVYSTAAVVLAACGGGGGGGTPVAAPPVTTTQTVGGTVSGLGGGESVVLNNNGSGALTVGANGAFTFAGPIASGGAFKVTIATEPSTRLCTVANGIGTVATAPITNVEVACAVATVGTVPATGGTFRGGDVVGIDINAPPRASLAAQTIKVARIDPPAGLPTGFRALGQAVNVAIDKPASLNAPLLMSIRYTAPPTDARYQVGVVHHDANTGRYEPVTVLAHDPAARTVVIESRTFSPFAVVEAAPELLPVSHTVTGYTIAANGWNLPNFGNEFAPGGNCLGMSAYANWFFGNRPRTEALNGSFSTVGTPTSPAELVITRAHLAQSQYWGVHSSTYLSELGDAEVGRLMKVFLRLFDQPLVAVMGDANGFVHAGIIFGYTATGFRLYDVNFANTEQTIPFNGTAFGTYSFGGTSYSRFSFVALPSFGRTEDFEALTSEALAGFTASAQIVVDAPVANQQIAVRSTKLRGSITGLDATAQLIAYVRGIPQLVPTTAGRFETDIPIGAGANTIVLVSGDSVVPRSNWARNSATRVVKVTGLMPPTRLLATLTWDQDRSDVDLYVTEPAPSNQTAFFSNKLTSNNLSLDIDRLQGFGPEHVSLNASGAPLGVALSGRYRIRVHYNRNPTGAPPVPVTGAVAILTNEGSTQKKFATKAFTVSSANAANVSPTATGPDWVEIGTVDLATGVITLD